MRWWSGLLAIFWLMPFVGEAQEYDLESPYGYVRAEISVGSNISFRVRANGRYLVQSHGLGLDIGKKLKLGEREGEPETVRFEKSEVLRCEVPYRSAQILDEFNGLKLKFPLKGFEIEFRAYDEGFAYRFILSRGDSINIFCEEGGFDLMGDPDALFAREKSFFSSNENWYTTTQATKVGRQMSAMPLTFIYSDGSAVSFTETGLNDYPSAYLKGNGRGGFDLAQPKVAAWAAKFYDRLFPVVFTKNYVARTSGTRALPWRVLMIGERQEALLANNLPWILANERAIVSTDWIKPGLVAWDWWHASRLDGVPFKSGLNTETYRYYIDFAAANKLPYIIIDEGWYKLGNLLAVKPEIDVPALVKYADSKGVKVILWVVWKTLQNQFTPAFEQFSAWGVAGIKMDFMMRNDQAVVNFMEQTVAEAAKRKMVVDLHGTFAPKGWQRKYPNLLTVEGVRGLEQTKWSRKLTPTHDCTLPITRQLAGPMDYTPGAFHNQHQKKFKPKFMRPSSMGTRAHEVAKYVVFESPLAMLADAPTAYQKDTACTRFITQIPTTWDTTVVLSIQAGHHVAIARKKGDTWHIAAMAGDHPVRLHLETRYLGQSPVAITSIFDGDATRADASKYELKRDEVITPGDHITLNLPSGGGWVARTSPVK